MQAPPATPQDPPEAPPATPQAPPATPPVPPARSDGSITSEPVASVKDVSQRYGKAIALDGISLDFPSQKMIGLIGPDGVGKSTLLGIIAGVRKLQSGRRAGAWWQYRRCTFSQCGILASGIPSPGSGKESVSDPIDLRERRFLRSLFGQSREEREWRIKELLASTDLTPFRDRPAGKLSGGMKQKLGLCCSLIHDPDLLILDEPTTGVDPLARRQFWELIDRIRGPPAKHERDGCHRLHGRSRTIRLAGRDERRQGPRDRNSK